MKLAVRFLERYTDYILTKISLNEDLKSKFLDMIFDSFNERLDEKAWSTNKTGQQPWANDSELNNGVDKFLKELQKYDKKIKDSNSDERRFLEGEKGKKQEEFYDFLKESLLKRYVLPFKNKLDSQLKRASTKDAKVMVDVKSPKSIVSKLSRGKSLGSMGDILRAVILTKDSKDAEKVKDNMKNVFNLFKTEVKTKGSDKDFGYYGAYHYDIDFNGIICEVQIMTKRLWTYKEVGHDFYNKWRDEQAKNPEVKNTTEYKKDARMSKTVFSYGNGRRGTGVQIDNLKGD